MSESEHDLIEYLPDPTLVIHGGRTERSNRAARDLAARSGLGLDPGALFGGEFCPLFTRAREQGSAENMLALRTGLAEPPVFRVAVRRMGDGERYTVVLTDMSREFAWRERLASRNRELGVLNEIGAALSASLDLDTLAQRIYEQAGRVLDTTNCCVALYDDASGLLSFPLRVERHRPMPALSPRVLGNGLIEHVLCTRLPRLLNGDVGAEARALGLEVVGQPSTSWLGVPLLAEDRAIGVIALQHLDGDDRFDEHDLEVLTLIAGQAAAAVRNARLLAQARDAYRELSETQAGLLEAERLRSITETVGGLNHEVNNPLAAIAGNAQLLLREAAGLPAGAQDKVARILDAARRIQGVTGKMANLIHATSVSYPGNAKILDVAGSLAREDYDASGGAPPAAVPAGRAAVPPGPDPGRAA